MQRIGRLLIWTFTVLCVGGLHAQSIDEVVLIVNDQAITANEFRSLARVQNTPADGNRSVPQLGDPTTEAIINDALMLSHVAQIAPDEQIPQVQLNSAIASLAAQNQITSQQLINQLNSEGVDTKIFVDSIRNRLLIQNVISQPLSRRVKVSNSEIQEYISNRPELKAQVNNEYELYHLVVKIDDAENKVENDQALAVAKQIKAKLEVGVTFQQILTETPEAASGEIDGYLGWKATNELPELFVWALDKLQPGQVSSVLKSNNGLHLVKLVDKRGEKRTVNEYQIRHILKRLKEDEDPSIATSELLALKDDLSNGASFAEVASKESDDRGSAIAGGNLGWVTLDTLVPGFATAVVSLAQNMISEPVRSRFGVHLIEVLDVREIQREFSAIETRARQEIFAEKVNSEIDDLLNELRSVAVIEVVN